MSTLRGLNEQLTRLLLVLAAVLAFLLCFLVVADVVGRVGLDRPVKGTTEIVSLSIVIICYLQTGFAIRSGGMLHVDMVVSRAGPRGQSSCPWSASTSTTSPRVPTATVRRITS